MVKTGLLWVGGGIAALIVVFLIAVAFGLMRMPLMNIEREVNQNSQEYIETKRSLLLSLLIDYEQAEGEEGRQQALINRICEEATLIQRSEYPPSVAEFVSVHCP